MSNSQNEIGAVKIGNKPASNQRKTSIRRYDINAIRVLCLGFYNSISANPDFIVALDAMFTSNRDVLRELYDFDYVSMKAFSIVFIPKMEARKRAINLIQLVLVDCINDKLDENDQHLIKAFLEKMILPVEKWAS